MGNKQLSEKAYSKHWTNWGIGRNFRKRVTSKAKQDYLSAKQNYKNLSKQEKRNNKDNLASLKDAYKTQKQRSKQVWKKEIKRPLEKKFNKDFRKLIKTHDRGIRITSRSYDSRGRVKNLGVGNIAIERDTVRDMRRNPIFRNTELKLKDRRRSGYISLASKKEKQLIGKK